MKKYKLNPDKLLPFTNEEMEATITIDAFIDVGYLISHNKVRIFIKQDSDLQTWLDSGYILEVKPREWWIGKDSDGGIGFYDDKSQIRNDWDEIIHVQEID